MRARFFSLLLVSPALFCQPTRAQLADPGTSDSIRVTVAQNQDGSRTSYQFDNANHKAIATTTNSAGKTLSKIRYDLDDAGRFSAGEVCGPDGKVRFKTQYKYDTAGRLLQETQLTKDNVVRNKIVYAYGTDGKQTGFSVYDGDGGLLGQTTPNTPSNPKSAQKKKGP